MTARLPALFASVATLFASLATAADWVPVVKDLSHKVPRIEVVVGDGGKDACSGAIINSAAGFALSAAHCFKHQPTDDIAVTLNGRHAEIVRTNTILDLAVLRFTPRDETTICISKTAPELGSEVLIVGYAFGAKGLHVQAGNVSNVLDEDDWLVVAADVIFGDSGGAAVNPSGCLVGMVSSIRSAGPAHLGLMVPSSVVRDFVDQYLPPN